MSNPGQKATASSANDTDHRRTWDRDEYARMAREREDKRREDGKARAEAKAAGKTYHKRAATPPDAKQTEARSSRIDVAKTVGGRMLVPANAAVGKRGRGAGFYCAACDLTFRDNLALVEHYNSKQHLVNAGETGEVAVATVVQVHARLRWLKRRRVEQELEDQGGMEERVELARQRGEDERARKRAARQDIKKKAEEARIKREGGWDM